MVQYCSAQFLPLEEGERLLGLGWAGLGGGDDVVGLVFG